MRTSARNEGGKRKAKDFFTGEGSLTRGGAPLAACPGIGAGGQCSRSFRDGLLPCSRVSETRRCPKPAKRIARIKGTLPYYQDKSRPMSGVHSYRHNDNLL